MTDWTGYRTTGSWLAEALGRNYVALGLTAYRGKAGSLSVPAWTIPPAPEGSLEAQWAPATGFRFIGRRELGTEEWVGRFFGLAPAVARWGTVLDGGIVFREVTPVTAESGGS